ncbi:MAG: YhcH/YjgK/YiaL family protein, partial [Synergistaceae bacterium]|nr:YhcH/YjgK/YiaL family protein [Synergistaceae bacterium]
MLYGNIHNEFFASQLKLLPAPLAAALKFLKDNELTKHEPGKFDITLDGVNMILQVLDIETKLRNELLPEIHRKYIDV